MRQPSSAERPGPHADELIHRALADSRQFLAWLDERNGTLAGRSPAERLLPHEHS